MKTLKFDHNQAELIKKGEKSSTWRLFDDKDLKVNDNISILDKVDPNKPETWLSIGIARITEIVEKRLEDIAERDMTGHENFSTKKDMINTYRAYYGDTVSGTTPVKIIYFDFEPASPTQKSSISLVEAKIYTDGGSRGNPGPSACAFVICNMDDIVVEKSGAYIGLSTNNKAEYQGLRLGLERAKESGIEQVKVFMDSQLVVNQVKGLFKVRNIDLIPAHQEVGVLIKLFSSFEISYIPRQMNKIADAEVNSILDDQKVL